MENMDDKRLQLTEAIECLDLCLGCFEDKKGPVMRNPVDFALFFAQDCQKNQWTASK